MDRVLAGSSVCALFNVDILTLLNTGEKSASNGERFILVYCFRGFHTIVIWLHCSVGCNEENLMVRRVW